MTPAATLRNDILDVMEEFESQVRALKAISGLLCGCTNADSVEPSELPYLLDPIIDHQNALIEQVREAFNRPCATKSPRFTTVHAAPSNPKQGS